MHELEDALRELVSMKDLDEYSLRVIAQVAHTTLYKLQHPLKNKAAITSGLLTLRGSLPRYFPDSNLRRVYDVLGRWVNTFRAPGSFSDNSIDNPISLPNDDSVPGAMIHQWAIEHHYSKEFSDELQEYLAFKAYVAKDPEEVHLHLVQAAAELKHKGAVYVGTPAEVDMVRRIFRKHEMMYDKYPIRGGYVIWIPESQRDAARSILESEGIRPYSSR